MNKIEVFDYYLLRFPALSYDKIIEINNSNSKQDIEAKLRKMYAVKDFQDAIFLASEELYKEMLKWLSNANIVAPDKLLISLYKYTLRMGVRATPYGTFAGISLGQVNEKNSSFIFDGGQKKITRLDMSVSTQIASFLSNTKELKGSLQFHVNTTLYLVKGVYRYYKYRFYNGKKDYSLAGLKISAAIQVVIDHCKNKMSYDDLIEVLLLSNVSQINAESFLNTLIENQVIVSELEQKLTGEEFFQMVQKVANRISPKGMYSNALRNINLLLHGDESIAIKSAKIIEIIHQHLSIGDTKNLLQTDLVSVTTENKIKSSVTATIAAHIKDLTPLNRGKTPSSLIHFITQFQETYGERVIPLLEALDNDFGIGYGNNEAQYYSEDVLIGQVSLVRKKKIEQTHWNGFQQLALRLLLRSKESGLYEIELTREDLKQLETSADPIHLEFPPTFYAIGNLVAESTDKLDKGAFKFNLVSCSGPAAIPLMARFGNLDPELANKLQQSAYVEQQKYPDAILAEIVHLPESRTGNILQRPQLRKYEIPFLSKSAAEQEKQILLSDLFIHIADGKIVLQSKKHKKVVIPRLSTAHNYTNGLAVYRFLADLQYQNESFAIRWDWEKLSNEQFLPRVSYGNIILSRARWVLQDNAYKELGQIKSDHDVTAFCERYRLPDKVILAEGDNELLIDFYNSLARQVLLEKLKKKSVILHEFLFAGRNSPIKNNLNEVYTNELIIPFYSDKQVTSTYLQTENSPSIQRSFPLGSEWTYVKIYCSRGQADKILTGAVAQIIEKLVAEKLIAKWFFIRYHDSGNHIRLRFLSAGLDAGQLPVLVTRIYEGLKDLLACGTIRNIQYDVYERELERYGIRNIEASESIFHHDSIFVLEMLKRLNGHLQYRWLIAALGVDQLLMAGGLLLQEKLELMTRWRNNFFAEFSDNGQLNYQLNNTYRTNKDDLLLFMKGEHILQQNPLVREIFASRKFALEVIFNKIKTDNKKDNDLQSDFYLKLLPSFSHMFINRLFFTEQRFYELAIYHCLLKYYSTVAATRKPCPRAKKYQKIGN